MKNYKTALKGIIGENLVTAELARRNIIATTLAGNIPDIDILAYKDNKSIPIQVKATYEEDNPKGSMLNMGWIIAGAIILFVLLVLILIPKAAKPYKAQASWGRGFSRVYFLLAFLYAFFMALLETDYLFGEDPTLAAHVFVFILIFIPLILIFYVLKWVFSGFKK